ncbi:MAG: SHOCT domain-containing protein [Deltaproteobacteria bacterium]
MKIKLQFLIVLIVTGMASGCSTPSASQKNEEVTVIKVPLLGDIPVIGALFRSKQVHARPTSPPQLKPETASNTDCQPASATTADTIPARLVKVKELKDSGAITEEEYQARRKVLVDKL